MINSIHVVQDRVYEFLKDKYIHEIMPISKTQNIFCIHKVLSNPFLLLHLINTIDWFVFSRINWLLNKWAKSKHVSHTCAQTHTYVRAHFFLRWASSCSLTPSQIALGSFEVYPVITWPQSWKRVGNLIQNSEESVGHSALPNTRSHEDRATICKQQ